MSETHISHHTRKFRVRQAISSTLLDASWRKNTLLDYLAVDMVAIELFK